MSPRPEVAAHVYRAPMWSRLDEVDRAVAVAWALDQGVCGVGGRLDAAPRDLQHAVIEVERTWEARTAARLRRFAELARGSEVWTRDGEGLFHRGELEGPWRYDPRSAAYDVDLTHVRACWWGSGPVDPPPAVLASFGRGGRNFQRIRG